MRPRRSGGDPPEKRLHRYGRAAVLAAGVVFALLAVVLIGLHTPPGRRAVAERLAEHLSGNGVTVRIGALQGSPLRAFTLREVTLADADGDILTADRVRVHWRLFPLLAGRFDIRALAIHRVELKRLPAPGAMAAAALQLGDIAGRVEADVAHVGIERILLPGDMPATYRAEGDVALSAARGGADVRVTLDRLDQTQDNAHLTLRIDPDTRAVVLDMAANETQAGWLSLLFGRAARPISIEGQGSGTLDNFSATVVMMAGAESRVEFAGRTERTGARRHFRLTAAAEMGALVGPELAPFFAGVSQLRVSGVVQPDGRVQLQQGLVQLAAANVRVRGEIVPARETADILVDLDAARAGPVALLVPWAAGWRELKGTGRLAGSLRLPRASFSLSADEPVLGPMRAGRLTASLDLSPVDEGAAPSLRVDARGIATGLSVADPALAPQFGSDVSWEVKGSAQSLPEIAGAGMTVAKAELRSGEAALTYHGQAGLGGMDGDFSAQNIRLPLLVPRVATSGMLTASGHLQAEGPARLHLSRIAGTLTQVATGLSWLDPALAGDLSAKGGLGWTDGALSLEGLSVSGSAIRLRGDGRTDGDGLGAEISLPDAAILTPMLSGAVAIDLKLEGKFPELAGEVTASLPQGSLRGQPIRGLVLRAAAKPVGGALAGSLQLAGSIAGEPLLGLGALVPAAPGRLSIQPFEAMLGPLSAGGTFSTDLSGSMEGRVGFATASLGEFGALLPYPLTGRLQGSLDVKGTTVRLTAIATDVRVPQLRSAAAQIEFGGEWDGRRRPRGQVVARGVSVHGHVLDRLRANVELRETATLVAVDGTGRNLAFSGRGRLVPLPGEMRVGLETMLLEMSGERIAVPNPIFLKLSGGTLTLDNALLRASGGDLLLNGSIGEQVDLHLTATCVPLSLVRLAYPSIAPEACVSGTADVGGPRASPTSRFALTLAGTGADKLDGTFDGEVGAGALSGKATLSGPATHLSMEGSWPFGDGPMDLQAKGRLQLGLLKPLGLVPGAATLSGNLAGDVHATGTSAAPRFQGKVEGVLSALRDGPLELRNAALSVTAEGDRIELTRAQASLLPRGRISVHGPITFPEAGGADLDLQVDAEAVDIAPTPLISARADATLTLTGALARPKLEGLLALRDAKLVLGAPGEPAPASALILPMAVRLKATMPSGIRLQGQGIDADFGGEILVEGEAGKAAASGALQMRRGNVQVGRGRVPLTAGTLSFSGPLDPALALDAMVTDSSGPIALVFGGTLGRPAMKIATEPPSPPDDALGRLFAATGQADKAKDPAFVAGALPLLGPARP